VFVAILDTGVFPGIFPVGPIAYDMEVTPTGIVRPRKSKIQSFHGTMVAAILELYAHDYEICSIKIFDDETDTTTCKMLCSALKWCLKKNIPIINVSAGCLDLSEFKRIGKIVELLHRNGQTVVAAYERNGMPAMPAEHKTVIGVRSDPSLHNDEYYFDTKSSKRDYVASGQHKLHYLTGSETIDTAPATSFAAPLITAALVNTADPKPGAEGLSSTAPAR
jgi:Subtilase family.